ncbi:MAG: hypothetical protein IMZ61_01290 [Planctomycetes bacterium]|nr:hypothetical protein [Planctomycetota bacterium]
MKNIQVKNELVTWNAGSNSEEPPPKSGGREEPEEERITIEGWGKEL